MFSRGAAGSMHHNPEFIHVSFARMTMDTAAQLSVRKLSLRLSLAPIHQPRNPYDFTVTAPFHGPLQRNRTMSKAGTDMRESVTFPSFHGHLNGSCFGCD